MNSPSLNEINDMIELRVEDAVRAERERCAKVAIECEEVSLSSRELIAREIRSGT